MLTPNISIEPYVFSNGNPSQNAYMVSIDVMRIYFSYTTAIAFYTPNSGLVVSRNYWSVTTGKHLNAIDGGNKSARVDEKTFNKMYSEYVSKFLHNHSHEWYCRGLGLDDHYPPTSK